MNSLPHWAQTILLFPIFGFPRLCRGAVHFFVRIFKGRRSSDNQSMSVDVELTATAAYQTPANPTSQKVEVEDHNSPETGQARAHSREAAEAIQHPPYAQRHISDLIVSHPDELGPGGRGVGSGRTLGGSDDANAAISSNTPTWEDMLRKDYNPMLGFGFPAGPYRTTTLRENPGVNGGQESGHGVIPKEILGSSTHNAGSTSWTDMLARDISSVALFGYPPTSQTNKANIGGTSVMPYNTVFGGKVGTEYSSHKATTWTEFLARASDSVPVHGFPSSNSRTNTSRLLDIDKPEDTQSEGISGRGSDKSPTSRDPATIWVDSVPNDSVSVPIPEFHSTAQPSWESANTRSTIDITGTEVSPGDGSTLAVGQNFSEGTYFDMHKMRSKSNLDLFPSSQLNFAVSPRGDIFGVRGCVGGRERRCRPMRQPSGLRWSQMILVSLETLVSVARLLTLFEIL